MKKHIYIGKIPDIFGYGIMVASDTESGAMEALRSEYNRWKKMRPDASTRFEKSYEYWGGYIEKMDLWITKNKLASKK
jgi:hypothetical protein